MAQNWQMLSMRPIKKVKKGVSTPVTNIMIDKKEIQAYNNDNNGEG